MIVHISGPQNSTKEFLQLLQTTSAKSPVYDYLKEFSSLPLYNDKWDEKEISETIPFTVATNNVNYLGVILTKHMKDLCDKNFKSLKKEMKKTSEDGKVSHAHGSVGLT